MKSDIWVGLIGVLFGATVLFLVPYQVGRDGFAGFADVQSPTFFPLMLSSLLIVISLGFMIINLIVRLKQPANFFSHDAIEMPSRLAATAITLVAYYLLLRWLGMVIASTALIFCLATILGFKKYWISALLAISLPVLIHLLFRRVLYVMLPEGSILNAF